MAYEIDVSRGSLNSTVSNQWATRPDDQKFLDLNSLRSKVAQWANESTEVEVLPKDITALFDQSRPDYLGVAIDGNEVDMTHFAFDNLARIAGAPANYLRSIPGPLAAVNLNYGFKTAEPKAVEAYLRKPANGGDATVRGLTSVRYGRILDVDVVDAVQKIAGNGTGDTRWKVPGTIEWGSRHGIAYNPEVEITKQNTTLYASDRDIFLFLVDDMNPIEVGKLASGAPDLMFRGFYVWNSEVGARTFGVATMYLRGVCQNRNLWGVEGFNEITFRHTSGAPERFLMDAAPALLTFAEGATDKLRAGVFAAKAAKVATDDEERIDFLARFGFSGKASQRVIDTALAEEGTKPETVWDFAQGVTALARREELQEARLKLEAVAGKMLDRVKV
jgi:hypothetical protein